MKNKLVHLIFLILLPVSHLLAQDKPYADVARERAEKIVTPLNLQDQRKIDKVKVLVADQYITLNQLHKSRDEQLKTNKKQTEVIKKASDEAIAKLHKSYLKKLGKELNAVQIEEVKNGMTYHTVPLTYKNYLLMLPYLEEEEKSKISLFLGQAREHAMDGGTSKEKHAWFNKYKGKIANFLSEKGYQLKLEGEEWAKRSTLTSQSLEITASNQVMTALNMTDKAKAETLRNLIAHHYQQIIKIHAVKAARTEAAKKLEKSEAEKISQAAWEECIAKLDRQRALFFAALSKFLAHDQIEIVKNEMTAHGVKKETDRFYELLPHLTPAHKAKINDYLLEARENALHVLTNRERNQWFTKYRGRVNNYLSAQGYDLRKATEELEKKKLIKK